MLNSLFLILITASAIKCDAIVTAPKSATIVIVVDGLRQDYFRRDLTPKMYSMSETGVVLEDVFPVFPSAKYPNIVSMMTGTFAENHNVLDEEIYDSKSKRTISKNETVFWKSTRELGTIWTSFQKEYPDGIVEVIGFPEYEMTLEGFKEQNEIDEKEKASEQKTPITPLGPSTEGQKKTSTGEQPTKTEKSEYDPHWPENYSQKMKNILREPLANGKPVFITVFIDEPGRSAQSYGPENMTDALKKVDDFVGDISDYLFIDPGSSEVMKAVSNLIVLSTPSYVDVELQDVITLSKYVNNKPYKTAGSSPNLNVVPQNADDDLDIFSALKSGESDGYYNVYIDSSIPNEWHYSESTYAPKMLVVAKPGLVFLDDFIPKINHWRRTMNMSQNIDLNSIFGANGYDPAISPKVHSIALARGPAFQEGLSINPVTNASQMISSVDLFHLLAFVLEIDEHDKARNGSLKNMYHILKSPPDDSFKQTIGKITGKIVNYVKDPQNLEVSIILLIVISLILVSMLCICLIRRRQKRRFIMEGFRYSKVKNNRRHHVRNSGLGDMDENFLDEFDDDQENETGEKADEKRLLDLHDDEAKETQGPSPSSSDVASRYEEA